MVTDTEKRINKSLDDLIWDLANSDQTKDRYLTAAAELKRREVVLAQEVAAAQIAACDAQIDAARSAKANLKWMCLTTVCAAVAAGAASVSAIASWRDLIR